MKNFLFLCFIFILAFLLPGCVSYEYTTQFYRITTSNPPLPKPANQKVPILKDGATKRSYKVIGEFEFESESSYGHIMGALQYNAQRSGADAVLINDWSQDDIAVEIYYPAHMGLSYYYGCDNGLYYRSYFTPYVDIENHTIHRVVAQMIVFVDKDTFGIPGFIFENVKNVDYLEVGQVLAGSGAQEAGILQGDYIFKINDYSCDKGLEHYYKSGPSFKIGETVELKMKRDGKTLIKSFTVTSLNKN